MHEDHPGAEELGRRLEAYASARLAPRRGSAARIRVALIEEARMRTLETGISGAQRSGAGRRRWGALLLAASLALAGVAGVAAASTAGGPLYGARLWLETATLPTGADTRALERMHQIEARVLDVERATAGGDGNAVAAAIAAYREAVDTALTEAGSNADRLAHLRAALGLHVEVLQTLAGSVPGQAKQGIDRAIESSQQAVDSIDKSNPGRGNPQPGAGKPAATAEPVPTKTPGPSGKPAKSGHPGANASPQGGTNGSPQGGANASPQGGANASPVPTPEDTPAN